MATWQGPWLALLVISAAAWKGAARDRWIGWDRRYQYDRLHLMANNSRFLILPEGRRPNLASRVLGLCERRVAADWQARFGYPLWLLETFVDPRFFRGTCYRAANWLEVGAPCVRIDVASHWEHLCEPRGCHLRLREAAVGKGQREGARRATGHADPFPPRRAPRPRY